MIIHVYTRKLCIHWCILQKPAVKHGEVAHCERSEKRGSGGGGLQTDHFEALPHLIGVASVVDFGSILRLMYQVAIG